MDEPTREDRLVAMMTEQFQLVHRRLDVMQQTTDRRFDEARVGVAGQFEAMQKMIDRRFDEARVGVAGQFEAMQKHSDERLASEIGRLRSYVDGRLNTLTEAIDSFLLRRPRRNG